MRWRRTSIICAAEHTVHDCWRRLTLSMDRNHMISNLEDRAARSMQVMERSNLSNTEDHKTRYNLARRMVHSVEAKVSPNDPDFVRATGETRAKLDKCVVLSMPCVSHGWCSGKSVATPMSCGSGTPAARLGKSWETNNSVKLICVISRKRDMLHNSTASFSRRR